MAKKPKKDEIHDEALKRLRIVDSYELENRDEGRDDLRMIAGKNHWPQKVYNNRTANDRPCITINKLPGFTDQIVNDSRLNKVAIKVRPDGGGATSEMAQVISGLIRNIENASDAVTAYETALEAAVQSGFGFFRIITEYAGDDSFDLDIKIKRIKNQFTVFIDPRAEEVDKRDARFAFITEKISEDEFKARFPGRPLPSQLQSQFGDEDTNLWVEENLYRIAEYWVRTPVKKRLYGLSDGRTVMADDWDLIKDDLKAQEQIIHLAPSPENPNVPIEVEGPAPEGSGLPETVLNPAPTVVRERMVETFEVSHYLIDGADIIEGPTKWPGKWIPIIPVMGKETTVDDRTYTRSAIRFAKDPQRLYNYFRSAAAETVALAPKAPYVMEEEQIEGHETAWQNIGQQNPTYLLYKHKTNVPPPSRQVVTATAIGEITEAQMSNDEMKATTSLFDASLGSQGNETSGRAILARQREGDVANFTFHDNLRRGVKFAGDILVDLIPRVFDTERQLVVVGDDDEESTVMVNQEVIDAATGETVIINDLSLGKYKLVVTVGPSFTTQRVEAAESMLDFIRTAPNTAAYIIDLVAENMDWPGAAKIAARFRKLLPPGLDDEGPMPPQQPSVEDQIKGAKLESIGLGNKKKEQDIREKQQEMAEEGATGALQAIGLMPQEGQG